MAAQNALHQGSAAYAVLALTNTHQLCIIIQGCGRMKRKDLINLLKKNGWYCKRNGGNHDIYTNGTENETIARHNEIPELLAKAIIKRRGLK
jgi:mRNA interferase HicA